MIKIDYRFNALTPLHTGSDQDAGIMKTLRRQKVVIDAQEYDSEFSDEERIDAIVSILYAVHQSLDWQGMDNSRKMHIWDEAYSKILKAAATRTRFQFFNALCSGWGVRSVNDEKVLGILERLNDAEFFDTVRNETHYLILKLRKRAKEKSAEPTLFDKAAPEKCKYIKTYEMLPCISGNSIRGVLRRLAMYDYCKLAGITKLEKSLYHQWFTGGVLNDSTQYEDIERREKLIRLNPMLGVFGAAIGNMTIEGMVSVGHAYPVCSEMGTGERSYWEYLDTIFQTRHDSSKTEKQIEVIGAQGEVTQMKYEYEVFASGTPFQHGFRMLDFDDLSVSAFWRVIRLFKESPIICGMWARGNAEIDLSELRDGDDSMYLAHVNGIDASVWGRENV